MANYSFTVTKKNIKISVTTSDCEFISQQFEAWVNNASDYAKKYKARHCKELADNKIKEEEIVTQQNIEKEISRHKEEVKQEVKEVKEEVKQEPKAEKTETKNDTVKNLDIFYAPVQEESQKTQQETINDKINTGVFDNILENSMNNPTTELSFKPNPSIKKDDAFVNFMSSRKIEKKVDYLLCTAYYFTQYEQKPRFTIKEINSKLMQNLAMIIDHSVLQEAINRDYMECLPDLTGLVGASEYRLTAYGEKVLFDE